MIIVFHSGDEATGLFKSKIVPESIYTEPDYQESDFKKIACGRQMRNEKREIITGLNWSTYNYGTSQLLVWRNAFSSIVEELHLLFGFGKVMS